MKKIFIIVALFYFGQLSAQNLEKIRSADTIYFYFKNLKQQEKVFQETTTGKNSGEYYFNYLSRDRQQYVIFTFNYNLKPAILTESKSFLRKNKGLVIDYHFLKQYTVPEINELFKNKRHIYLIDSKEFVKCKIKLKEVIYQSSTFLEM